MKTMQEPEFDYSAVALDLVRYLRERWPDAGAWRQAQALILAVYAVDGPEVGAAVLSACIPTVSSKGR